MTWDGNLWYFGEDGKIADPEKVTQEKLKILEKSVVAADGGKKNPKPSYVNGGQANCWRGLGYRGR